MTGERRGVQWLNLSKNGEKQKLSQNYLLSPGDSYPRIEYPELEGTLFLNMLARMAKKAKAFLKKEPVLR